MTIIREQLSIDAQAYVQMALAQMLSYDERLHARALQKGIAAEEEEMRALEESIAQQRVLYATVQSAVSIDVLVPRE